MLAFAHRGLARKPASLFTNQIHRHPLRCTGLSAESGPGPASSTAGRRREEPVMTADGACWILSQNGPNEEVQRAGWAAWIFMMS